MSTGQTRTSGAREASRGPLRVLIVEDDTLSRWALTETLADAGHFPIEAVDAASAVSTVQGEDVDVILLDYFLPDSKDLKLLTQLRALAPAAPVIMVTGHASDEMKAHALKLGAHQVLSKPLDMPDIPALVRQAFQTA
jgi:DNA-binding NtrC family response regulator